MSYLTKEYAEKEALCLENVNVNKADLPQVSIFFRTQFPSLEIFAMKKLKIEKTNPTFIILVLKVVYFWPKINMDII